MLCPASVQLPLLSLPPYNLDTVYYGKPSRHHLRHELHHTQRNRLAAAYRGQGTHSAAIAAEWGALRDRARTFQPQVHPTT